MREIYERVFLFERERFSLTESQHLVFLSYVFGTSLMKVNTHALIRREED